jgi:hypothetical protein
MVDLRLERLAKRGGDDDQLARVGGLIEIACECGRSGCAEVIALPWCVYEQAQKERRLLLATGHELPGIRRPLSRYDGFVVVAKVEPAAAAIAENDSSARSSAALDSRTLSPSGRRRLGSTYEARFAHAGQ